MEDIWGCFFAVSVFGVICGVRILYVRLQKLYRSEYLFKRIGWIAEKESTIMAYEEGVNLRDEELIYYILQYQEKVKIPENLRINYTNESEKADIEKILNLHRTNTIRLYFSGFLTIDKRMRKFTQTEYYFFSLFCFLCKNAELDTPLLRDEIYRFNRCDGAYSYYNLTDFGRAFFKLHLVVSLYCERNINIKQFILEPQSSHYMDYLETNEVCFWHYHP